MSKKYLIFSVLILMLTFCLEAQVYYYKDNNNNLVFTNTPTDNRVKVLRRDSFVRIPNIAHQLFNRQYSSLLEELCYQHNMDRKLVEAVIEVESDFNPWVVSRKGARGLMQLMPKTAALYGVKNIFNIRENLTGGIKHLKYLLQTYNNNLDLTLAAYNAGGEAVKKYGGIPPYRETRNYVRKVKQIYYGHGYAIGSSYKSTTVANTKASKPKKIYRYFDKEGNPHYTTIPPSTKSYQIIKTPK